MGNRYLALLMVLVLILSNLSFPLGKSEAVLLGAQTVDIPPTGWISCAQSGGGVEYWKTLYSYTAPTDHVITGVTFTVQLRSGSMRITKNGSVWYQGSAGTYTFWADDTEQITSIAIQFKSGTSISSDRRGQVTSGSVYTAAAVAGEITEIYAQQAKTSADAAKSSADAAKTAADTAAARVWDSTEGKSAALLAKEARDRANEAVTAVSALQASVGPQIHRVQGLNGATATTGSSFSVVIDASGATEFRARCEGGSWTGWTSVDNPASVSGLSSGANTIQVEVKNATGQTATGWLMVFRV